MRIGELAKQTGIAAHTIRFYESRGLLPKPRRGANGYRSYDDESVQVLSRIQCAQRLGFSLDDMISLMGEQSVGEGLDHDKLLSQLDVRLEEVDVLLQRLLLQKEEIIEFRKRLEASWELGLCMQPDELGLLHKDSANSA